MRARQTRVRKAAWNGSLRLKYSTVVFDGGRGGGPVAGGAACSVLPRPQHPPNRVTKGSSFRNAMWRQFGYNFPEPLFGLNP